MFALVRLDEIHSERLKVLLGLFVCLGLHPCRAESVLID